MAATVSSDSNSQQWLQQSAVAATVSSGSNSQQLIQCSGQLKYGPSILLSDKEDQLARSVSSLLRQRTRASLFVTNERLQQKSTKKQQRKQGD